MNSKTKAVRTVAWLAVIVVIASTVSATAPLLRHQAVGGGTCADTSAGYMNEMIEDLNHVLSSAAAADLRETLGLADVPPNIAKLRVASDSLCDRAGRLMNWDFYLPDTTTRKVFMIRIGNRYLASDSTLPPEDRIPGYLLDSTLTTILHILPRQRIQ